MVESPSDEFHSIKHPFGILGFDGVEEAEAAEEGCDDEGADEADEAETAGPLAGSESITHA